MSVFDALKLASVKIEKAQKNEAYKRDIRLWAWERLGYPMWNKQVAIAEALIKHRRVAVKSGHGVGKTFVSSIILAWFVETHQDVEALAVTTAPTQPQLDLIWENVRKHHNRVRDRAADGIGYPLLGRITLENVWKGDDDTKRAYGRKPSDNNPHAFQGEHRNKGVLALIDEGCGVPDSIFTAVDAITTGGHDMALCVGNPDDINTPFGRIWSTDDPTWYKMTISSFDSPNITGEDFPEEFRGGLVSKQWIENAKLKWGEDSARYKSKVLGEFSESSTAALFTQQTLAAGIETEISIPDGTRPRLGVDIARYGDDYTVVYAYQAGVLRFVERWAKADLVESAERIHGIACKLDASEVRIDGVGIGAGVYDMVTALSAKYKSDYKVIGMIGNAQSPDLHKWVNARAWWYDTMREKMLRGRIDIDFADKDLKMELEGIQYKFGASYNALQIESKDDMKKRGVKSPDFADAAMYACADLPIDPEHPLSAIPLGEEFQLGLEEFLAAEDRMISPY